MQLQIEIFLAHMPFYDTAQTDVVFVPCGPSSSHPSLDIDHVPSAVDILKLNKWKTYGENTPGNSFTLQYRQ